MVEAQTIVDSRRAATAGAGPGKISNVFPGVVLSKMRGLVSEFTTPTVPEHTPNFYPGACSAPRDAKSLSFGYESINDGGSTSACSSVGYTPPVFTASVVECMVNVIETLRPFWADWLVAEMRQVGAASRPSVGGGDTGPPGGFRQSIVEDVFSYARHNRVLDLERMLDQ